MNDASDEPEVLIRVEGHAGRITLNRPKALNALTDTMIPPIEAALDAWADDPAVAHVVIDATGERAFCAGGDIQKLYETGRAGDFSYGRDFWREEYRLNAKIARYPKPYVALMRGIVMGGGVGLSAHGSHRIVTESSLVAMPEVSIGFLPDVGGTWLLSRAPGHLGEYLGLTAARMGPADAIHAGFADAFIPEARLGDAVALLCERPVGDLVAHYGKPEPSATVALAGEIDRVFSAADLGAIAAALAAGDAEWAAAASKALDRNAPLSMACALEAIRRARDFDRLEDCLSLEYRFVSRSMEQADFLEGIRAAIIDKDRSPKWRVAELRDVDPRQVEALLAPLGADELVW